MCSDPPFEPRPSLRVLADYIVKDTVRTYPLEECPLCKKPALPDDPRVCSNDENNSSWNKTFKRHWLVCGIVELFWFDLVIVTLCFVS